MKRDVLMNAGVWVGWLVIGLMIAHVNLIGFSTTTLRWQNLQHPNATFRWASPVGKDEVIVAPSQPLAVKVMVPRAFTSGRLVVRSTVSAGRLLVSVPAPSGRTTQVASGVAGQDVLLPITWDDTALANRTFTVQIASEDSDVTLTSLALTLQRS